jgi:hypothetical protein
MLAYGASAELSPMAAVRDDPSAMQKSRIEILRFGTARRKMVLERCTNPKPLGTIVDRAAI